MVIQAVWFSTTHSTKIKLSLVPVLIGVIIVSVTDVSANTVGTMFALSAVFITSMYQIVCSSSRVVCVC